MIGILGAERAKDQLNFGDIHVGSLNLHYASYRVKIIEDPTMVSQKYREISPKQALLR